MRGTVKQLHAKCSGAKGRETSAAPGMRNRHWQRRKSRACHQPQDTEQTVQQQRAAARGKGADLAGAMLHPVNKQLPKLQQYCSACGQAVALKRRTARHAP